MQSSVAFVVDNEQLGTALGCVSICQNLGLMILSYLFSFIHDKTLKYKNGYFWSLLFFLTLSMISFKIKMLIGEWDTRRGSILNSKTPYKDYIAY